MHNELGVTQCSELLGIPRPTAHRLLTTLATAGALERTNSGTYRLSLWMFEIGVQVPFFRALQESSEVALEQLVAKTRLISHLAVREGTEVVYLLRICHQNARVQTRIGLRNPLYATALGKVLLAHAPKDVFARVFTTEFQRFTPFTRTDPQLLVEELHQVQQTGFGYDHEERQLGVSCIASGIRDATGKVVAAISISVPAESHGMKLNSLKLPLHAAVSLVEEGLAGL